ncbi:unnamed protein product [Orchesella dallaii]|uniref:Uncharacterized protein n=1 Tax=Orchesella dallaii TaxID=48710 RepID=A0ABP1PNJ8_9HEXA
MVTLKLVTVLFVITVLRCEAAPQQGGRPPYCNQFSMIPSCTTTATTTNELGTTWNATTTSEPEPETPPTVPGFWNVTPVPPASATMLLLYKANKFVTFRVYLNKSRGDVSYSGLQKI